MPDSSASKLPLKRYVATTITSPQLEGIGDATKPLLIPANVVLA